MPRFITRDLLWLILVVGLVLGWFRDRAGLVKERDNANLVNFRDQNEYLQVSNEASRLANAMEKAGWTVDEEGRMVRVPGFDPSHYPPSDDPD